MLVCAGTLNPCKLSGIRRAFTEFFRDVEVVGFSVSSSAPPQPIGLDLTISGARSRALSALRMRRECALGVGVEAGLYELGGHYYDVQVAVVVDRNGAASLGLSPSFQIPDSFARRIVEGEVGELEEVVDEFFRTKDAGEKGGFIKLLTNGAVTREDLTYYAVAMALVPLVNRELYGLT